MRPFKNNVISNFTRTFPSQHTNYNGLSISFLRFEFIGHVVTWFFKIKYISKRNFI